MFEIIKSRWVYTVPLVSAVALFLLFTQSSPESIGPAGILLVFVLLYVFFVSCLFIALHAGVVLLTKLFGERINRQFGKWQLEVKRAYYVASIAAFVPVILLAMQSLGQLQLGDIALVIVLASLVTFYVLRLTR